MEPAGPNFLTITEQAAAYLREELLRGRWSETIPGMNQLAPELGVNTKTAEAALQLLEKQKFLVSQGPGRRRRIVLPGKVSPPALRLTILPYDPEVTKTDYIIDIRHQLQRAGHLVDFAPKDLLQLQMNPRRIAQLVKKTGSDAWVVVAGLRGVMEWFAGQSMPILLCSDARVSCNCLSQAPAKARLSSRRWPGSSRSATVGLCC